MTRAVYIGILECANMKRRCAMGIKRKKAIISGECVACGHCVGRCPLGAIQVFKGMYALVDMKTCVGCGRCADACPAGVIRIGEREAAS